MSSISLCRFWKSHERDCSLLIQQHTIRKRPPNLQDAWCGVLPSEHFAPATDRDSPDSVGEALTFIVEHFRHDIRLGDLADRIGMSEWACSRFFERNSGNSFTDYVARLRVGHACKLLAETELPVTDIRFEVGYSNVSNFNRTFRLQRGPTPSACRRLARNRRLSAGVGPSISV
jgi:transcriptional regulator GlxA family with amidase domain